MKFTINREQLLKPLQQIAGIVEKKQTMPILSNMLFSVRKNMVCLTCTDLEIQLIVTIDLESSAGFEFTVPVRKLLDIVKLLPEEANLKFELDKDKIKVVSAKSRFSLSCLPAESYPEFSKTTTKNTFVVAADILKNALKKTIFCMGNQDVRYYLNGLLLHISNSSLKLVASDGHRLSFYEDSTTTATGYEERIILPRKGVLELYRLLEDSESELTVNFSENTIKVTHLDFIFYAKLIDAKYPDFNRVFEQSFLKPIQIKKSTLRDALNRVAILANEKFKGVSCDINNNVLKLSSHNPEHDEAEEELNVDYDDEALIISFNAQYLLDAVNNIDSEMVVLTIASNSSSCFINEPEQKSYKFIVMAMSL